MEDFLTAALQNSFSVVVAGYLLVRMEARLERLAGAIARLEAAIGRMGRRDAGSDERRATG